MIPARGGFVFCHSAGISQIRDYASEFPLWRMLSVETSLSQLGLNLNLKEMVAVGEHILCVLEFCRSETIFHDTRERRLCFLSRWRDFSDQRLSCGIPCVANAFCSNHPEPIGLELELERNGTGGEHIFCVLEFCRS